MALVAHYKLDGNADDELSADSGTVSTFSTIDGKIGEAVDMDASSNISWPAKIEHVYSFAFWVKLKSGHTGSFRKFLQKSSNRSPGFWFFNTSNRLHLRQVLSSTSNAGIDTSTALTINQWHHIVFTCGVDETGTTFTCYFDG